MTTPWDGTVDAAAREFREAADRLTNALTNRVRYRVRAAHPTAAVLHAEGTRDDLGDQVLYPRCIVDADGKVLAADFQPGGVEPTPGWEDLEDSIGPDLDWIAQLNGDDYDGEQQIGVVQVAPHG